MKVVGLGVDGVDVDCGGSYGWGGCKLWVWWWVWVGGWW